MKIKRPFKYLLVCVLLLASFVAMIFFLVFLSRHVLRDAPELLKWAIAVVLIIAVGLLFYFGKPLQPEKGWSKKINALRAVAGVVLGSLLGMIIGTHNRGLAYWMVMLSVTLIYMWCFIQILRKCKMKPQVD